MTYSEDQNPSQGSAVELLRSAHSSEWAAQFTNPLLKNGWDEPIMVRRSLGTDDKQRALFLCGHIAELIESPNLPKLSPDDVREVIDEVAIDAVFGAPAENVDYEQRRSEELSLPWHSDGYVRVMFVGTTGAGKTTLLRNLIGSNHHTDKFPSTSAGRTTTANIEIITGRDRYKGVVTFQSEHLVRSQIEECVSAAALRCLNDKRDADVADALLEHEDQTFRLKYILGDWEEPEAADELQVADDPWDFGDTLEDTSDEDGGPAGVDAAEREHFSAALRGYVERIRALADKASQRLPESVALTADAEEHFSAELEDAFEAHLRHVSGYADLVNDLLDEIIVRFKSLEESEALTWSATGWPKTWTYETDDRAEFLERMRWFASNYAPRYGKLLTPVVEGMRVQGPFQSEFARQKRKFVFIDGQGLGHRAKDAGSISSSITSRFGVVDIILVVDNAQQPMQKNSLEALRTAAVSGHVSKLGVAFTHFDGVKGDNLPTLRTRVEHVRKAFKQGIAILKEDGRVSPPIIANLSESHADRSFLFGWLHEAVSKMEGRKMVEQEVRRMFDWFEETAEPPKTAKATPVFEMGKLLEAIREGNRDFLAHWRTILGLDPDPDAEKEHWTRIKALNRRVVEHRNNYEYDNLKPIADLIKFVMNELSLQLDEPVDIQAYGASQADKEAAIDLVRQKVHQQLHDLFTDRLIHDHFEDWKVAQGYSGTGSTSRRAKHIDREVYAPAAPEFAQVDTSKLPLVFDEHLIGAVEAAVREAGGEFVAESVAS